MLRGCALRVVKYGNVNLFSELDQLTGIAALLRFPMPELEDESDGDSDSGEE